MCFCEINNSFRLLRIGSGVWRFNLLHKNIWKWQRHRNFISGIIIRLEHFDFGIMEDNLELHLNSLHQQVSDRARSTVLGGSMEFEEESGAGNIQVNSCNEVEDMKGYLNEKKHFKQFAHWLCLKSVQNTQQDYPFDGKRRHPGRNLKGNGKF